MPEQSEQAETDHGQADNQEQPKQAEKPKPQSLEDLLADLDEDRRKVILEQVRSPRNEAKNLRDRLKALEPKAAEYDRLEAASRTDLERVQSDLTAAQQRAAGAFARAARAEVKAALAGVVDNPDEIVDDLNLSKFVDEDGEVDQDAVATLKSRYAAFAAKPRSPRPDASQGSSGNKQTSNTPQEQFASFLKSSLQRG